MNTRTIHQELHFTAGETLRDIVIGMADGLTVPFALAAGMAGAVSQTSIICIAGVAEVTAGAVAMGLGGYLAARGEAEHYGNERLREEREIVEKTQAERDEITEIFQQYGVAAEECASVVAALERQPKAWVDFMMRFELGLEKPEPHRALASARNIALAYVVGGMVPLMPYFFIKSIPHALAWSAVFTLLALLVFGYIKGRFSGSRPGRSAAQTMLVGGLAAGVAFLVARLIV